MLVAFGDEADPTSVARVGPDDLAANFGEGVTLKRITVELTNDPVTTGIEERLGWLPQYFDKMLDGNRLRRIDADNRFANSLSQNSFSVGVIQRIVMSFCHCSLLTLTIEVKARAFCSTRAIAPPGRTKSVAGSEMRQSSQMISRNLQWQPVSAPSPMNGVTPAMANSRPSSPIAAPATKRPESLAS